MLTGPYSDTNLKIGAETGKTCPIQTMDSRDFQRFRDLVHEHTGIWLRDGKQIMLAARLSRQLRQLGLASFADYFRFLTNSRKDGPEFTVFINSVTTNKTSFFREPHHFNFLAKTVVPEIQAAALRGAPRRTRIWSAASSTGEEVYSIAITLLESLPKNSWSIEVVGSDIDTAVLAAAKRAIYPDGSLTGGDQAMREKYFLRGKDRMAGQIKVKPEVTSLVEFRRINLMDRDWPLEGVFDVIFFRNALIYFQQDIQDKFLRRMTRYLKPGGYLFLGNAEHIPWLHDILEPLNKTMYRLRGTRR